MPVGRLGRRDQLSVLQRMVGNRAATIVVQRGRFGAVDFDDEDFHRRVKPAIIKALGGTKGVTRLTSGSRNCDFGVAKDGAILWGPNGSKAKNGKAVTVSDAPLTYQQLFPNDDLFAQSTLESNRPANWDPFDIPSEDESDDGDG